MPKRLFTPEHIDFLAENAPGRNLQELTSAFNEHFALNISEKQVNGTIKYRKLTIGMNVEKRNHYTPEQIDFLKTNVAGRSQRELTDMFNAHFNLHRSVKQIHDVLDYRNLRSGTRGTRNAAHHYAPEQIDFLRENITGRTSKEITDLFNECFDTRLSVKQIKDTMYRHRLRSGLGLPEVHPVGSEIKRSNGRTYIKVARPNVWRSKHVLVWESVNGPLPEGYNVIFSDGNKQNLEPDNLILVSKKDAAIINTMGLPREDPQLRRAGIAVAKIIAKMSERRTQLYIENENKIKTCEFCGKRFNDVSLTIYCSKECRDSAYKAHYKQGEYVKIDRSPYQQCIVCGKSITQGERGRLQKYCSRACRRIKYKYSAQKESSGHDSNVGG